jgi:hypothetical protein
MRRRAIWPRLAKTIRVGCAGQSKRGKKTTQPTSATVLNTGRPRCVVPPFFGVMPPTILVPASRGSGVQQCERRQGHTNTPSRICKFYTFHAHMISSLRTTLVTPMLSTWVPHAIAAHQLCVAYAANLLRWCLDWVCGWLLRRVSAMPSPYSMAFSEWNVPCAPVKPWQITLVSFVMTRFLRVESYDAIVRRAAATASERVSPVCGVRRERGPQLRFQNRATVTQSRIHTPHTRTHTHTHTCTRDGKGVKKH